MNVDILNSINDGTYEGMFSSIVLFSDEDLIDYLDKLMISKVTYRLAPSPDIINKLAISLTGNGVLPYIIIHNTEVFDIKELEGPYKIEQFVCKSMDDLEVMFLYKPQVNIYEDMYGFHVTCESLDMCHHILFGRK